jgi:NitT/TauT family transport system permease protein
MASTTTSTPSSPGVARPPAAFATARHVAPRRRSSRVLVLQVLIGAVFLSLWQLASAIGLLNPLLFSNPLMIVQKLVAYLSGEAVYSRTIYDHLKVTVQEMAVGYALGASIGVAMGFTLGRSRLAARVLEPYILAIYSVPKIALAPLFILILGIGLESKVGVVLMEVFFLVFFNTFAGVRSVNEEYVQLAQIMGASRMQLMRRIVIPAALPSIMVGLKMGIPFAMIGAIIGEFIASNQGLGWLILYSSANFDAAGLFASIAFLVIIVWVLGQLLNVIEARLLKWRPAQGSEVVQI